MKILLPVCGPIDAKLIVDFVSNYNWPPHANFKVIHVLGSSDTEIQSVKAESAGTTFVTDITERLNEVLPTASTTCEVLSGAAIYEIITSASQWQADMIVMGSRTREDIESFLAGSVAKGVVMQATCSVVIIKPPQRMAQAADPDALVAAGN
jgi:nucleotide-binding universal stress UspA family protein